MRVLSLAIRHCNVILTGRLNNSLPNYVSTRSVRVEEKVKWIRPEKVHSYHPSKSGDLVPFEIKNLERIRGIFQKSELLKECSNEVQKVFMIGNQCRLHIYTAYIMELINKVKLHECDKSSLEVKIAKLTALIRIKQYIMEEKKKKPTYVLHELIQKRKRLLNKMRKYDYKKFEWLLEKLDLKFIPDPEVSEKVTRKKSVKLLAELQREKLKELKLADLKKKLDSEKIPFLEKKIEKLIWIKEQEQALNMKQTVFDSDIENLRRKIEEVKLDLTEKEKIGYLRKIHPYTLERY